MGTLSMLQANGNEVYIAILTTGNVGTQVPVPLFLLLFGGVGIALGIAMAGYRVMDTIGKEPVFFSIATVFEGQHGD